MITFFLTLHVSSEVLDTIPYASHPGTLKTDKLCNILKQPTFFS